MDMDSMSIVVISFYDDVDDIMILTLKTHRGLASLGDS